MNMIPRSLGLTSRHSLSHWDSLLLAVCIEANVDTLYSEDLGDPPSLKEENVSVNDDMQVIRVSFVGENEAWKRFPVCTLSSVRSLQLAALTI